MLTGAAIGLILGLARYIIQGGGRALLNGLHNEWPGIAGEMLRETIDFVFVGGALGFLAVSV